MSTVTLDLKLFSESLNRSLGWVWLQPDGGSENEVSPPSYTPEPPSVMPSFALVPSAKYRINYSVRYARFAYLLERDGSYEAGELIAFHDLSVIDSSIGDELTPPPEPSPFVPPIITTEQIVTTGSVGSLGVEFSFLHDDETEGTDACFRLGFKITDASPVVYPRLNLAYVTAFSMEGS